MDFWVGAVDRLLFAAKGAEQVVETNRSLNARVRDVSTGVNGAGNPRVFTGAHKFLLKVHPAKCRDHRNIYA